MNGSKAFIAEFVSQIKPALESVSNDVDVILAPPAVYLSEMTHSLEGCSVQVSGQNVAAYDSGAYTGEVSVSMLSDAGCDWCLVGHSERRALFGETDQDIVEKVRRLLSKGIKPILCVGETLDEREAGDASRIVMMQVEAVLSEFDETELAQLVVAYEPVWAIGTGKTATPEQAQEMHEVIRAQVAKKSAGLADNLAILYGGSVNAGNAAALFAKKDIDGGLVGGASLKVEEFSQICGAIG